MKATIKDVARAAGVSTATVSRALRNDARITEATRVAVQAAATRLAYIPRHAARSLSQTFTHTLGLVLPHIDGPYYADLLVGFETEAGIAGYSVIVTLAAPGSDATQTVRTLASQADGIAFLARSGASNELIASIGHTVPVVTSARPQVGRHGAYFVRNSSMAVEMTQHLIDHGRRHIAFVGLLEPGFDLGHRHSGYLKAMHAAGLEPTTHEVFPTEAAGISFARALMTDKIRHDALVCGNDELALAIMHELQDGGVHVGDELAITGWDDTVAARYVRPGLTTVSQPARQLGGLVAQRLVQRIAGTDLTDEVAALPAHMVHRTSCGCCNEGARTTPSSTPTPHNIEEYS